MVCIDRNSEITSYVLRYREASSDQREEAEIAVSGDEGGMYHITGLSPLTIYYIEVAAVSGSGIGPFAGITVQTPLYGKATTQYVYTCASTCKLSIINDSLTLYDPMTHRCVMVSLW